MITPTQVPATPSRGMHPLNTRLKVGDTVIVTDTQGHEHQGMYGGIGAAIGTGIDALIRGKKRLVYKAADAKPVTGIIVTPVITPRTKGIALSFAF